MADVGKLYQMPLPYLTLLPPVGSLLSLDGQPRVTRFPIDWSAGERPAQQVGDNSGMGVMGGASTGSDMMQSPAPSATGTATPTDSSVTPAEEGGGRGGVEEVEPMSMEGI